MVDSFEAPSLLVQNFDTRQAKVTYGSMVLILKQAVRKTFKGRHELVLGWRKGRTMIRVVALILVISFATQSSAQNLVIVGGRFYANDRRRRPPSLKMLAPTTPAAAVNDLNTYLEQGVTRIKIWIDDGTVQRERAVATRNLL